MKKLILLISALVLCAGNTWSMPLQKDIIQQIKQLPAAEQSALLAIPDGVNKPVATRRSGTRVTQAAAVVLLVDFSDNEADPSHTPADYDAMLFSTGTYPTGSMKDYYDEVSYHQFTLSGEVSDTWLRMPRTYDYYVNGNRGFGAYPRNAMKMVEDAIAAADDTIDFSQYDTDGNGFVDALFVVHAGPGFEETGDPNMIHSHMWDLHSSPQGPYLTNDGVYVGLYSVEPEEHAGGDIISIGVFCHEFGHVLGLPDLYDYDYDSEGIGNWGLMAGGAWGGDGSSPETPVHFCAWSKKELGWIQPQIITSDTPGLSVPAGENNPTAFRFIDSGSEYFLIENREKTGFDRYLYRSGLLVWHIDEAMSSNDHQCTEDVCPSHYRVALVQADGHMDLERNINRGDAGDPYPGSTGNRFFNTESTPHSWDYTGRPTWVGLNNISNAGDTMTLDVMLEPTRPFFVFSEYRIIGDDNGDGYPDAGERFFLEVTLKDYGLAQTGITGTLTAGGSIHVHKGTAVFGDFAQEETRSNSDDLFEVSIPEAVSRGYRETLTLSLTGTGGYTQTLSFQMILAPLPIDYEPGWESAPGYNISGCAGDINGDGYADLVLAQYMDSHKAYFNTGSGLALSAGWQNNDTPAGYARKTIPVDIAGDGYPELLFINVDLDVETYEYHPARSILYSNTTGMPSTTFDWTSQLHTAADADVGDVNGDGRPDLIIGCAGEQDVLYLGRPDGRFETEPAWLTSSADDTLAVTLADVNGDGDLDLIEGRELEPLQIYINRNGTLESAPSWSSDSRPDAFALATGDMDGDGDLDLAVGVYDGSDLVFRNNNGEFEKTPCWSSEENVTTSAIAWADIDEDGYPELFATHLDLEGYMPAGLSNAVYYNENGVLTSYAAWASQTERTSFGGGFADFNSDGHIDVYSVNFAGASTVFYNHVGACSVLGVALSMPSHDFTAGDPCSLTAYICNPNDPMKDVPLFILLDVYGDYWFAPSWISDEEGVDWYTINVDTGLKEMTIIPEFTWPSDVTGSASGLRFWGAMTDASFSSLLGEMDIWEFGYH